MPRATVSGDDGAGASGATGAADAVAAPASAAPPYQEVAAVSSFSGDRPEPPSYSTLAHVREAGKGDGSGPNPTPSLSCSPEREVSAPTTSVSVGLESLFEFNSVVRVLGVEDTEVHGELLTVVGFKADGGSGTVVLQGKGRVVKVPASKVYRVID